MEWKDDAESENYEPIVYGLKHKGRICISGTGSKEESNDKNNAITSRFWLSTTGAHDSNEIHCVDYYDEDRTITAKIYPFEHAIVDLAVLTHKPNQLCITSRKGINQGK
jgi:hypothetical protein